MTIPDTKAGSVYEITDHTVTIRGAYSMDGSGRPATPTSAMVAQARDICPDAQYLSATPSPTDEWTFLYLFRC